MRTKEISSIGENEFTCSGNVQRFEAYIHDKTDNHILRKEKEIAEEKKIKDKSRYIENPKKIYHSVYV